MQQITYPDKLNLVSVLGETISKMSTVQNLNNYYVSGTSGSDSIGNGMISNPWKTISKAINVLNAISGDITATVNIAAGVYTETFPTITKSGISLIGASSLPNVTVLNGNITFDMVANSSPTPFSIGGFQNIQLNGTLKHKQSQGPKNSLNVSNCLFTPADGSTAIFADYYGNGIPADMTVRDCLIYMSNIPAIIIDFNSVSMYNTRLINNPNLLLGTTSFIVITYGKINLSGCSITQTSTSPTVEPLIFVNGTIAFNSGSTINNCMLVYTSTTNASNKICIRFNGINNMQTYTVINNYLLCEGSSSGNCIDVPGSGTLNLIIGQNIASSAAKNVPVSSGSYTKTPLVDVV